MKKEEGEFVVGELFVTQKAITDVIFHAFDMLSVSNGTLFHDNGGVQMGQLEMFGAGGVLEG